MVSAVPVQMRDASAGVCVCVCVAPRAQRLHLGTAVAAILHSPDVYGWI
jgi:hypothetical protein